MATYTLDDTAKAPKVLRQVSGSIELEAAQESQDTFLTASELARRYRLDPLSLHEQLRDLYPDGDVPENDLPELAAQIEAQTRHYETREEHVEVALALVKPAGFFEERDESGRTIYTAEIAYRVDRESYLMKWEEWKAKNRKDLGFFYSPIEFDSKPEREFFRLLLQELNVKPWEVDDVYFTGGITDPAKTDFFIEYKAEDGRWRRYVPDFVIRKKPPRGQPPEAGRALIVEIKGDRERDDKINGVQGRKALAVRAWEALNPDRVKYEMIFTGSDTVSYDQMKDVFKFAETRELYLPIELDREELARFCRKWKVQQLELFGSILTFDFGPDSDVDFLVTFQPDARWGLEFVHMAEELSAIVGRPVDLVTRRSVERSENFLRRRNILESARTIYVA